MWATSRRIRRVDLRLCRLCARLGGSICRGPSRLGGGILRGRGGLRLCGLGRRLGGEFVSYVRVVCWGCLESWAVGREGRRAGRKEGRRAVPIIPPRPHAAKYCPLYSSIFGLGSALSSVDIFAAFQFLSIDQK